MSRQDVTITTPDGPARAYVFRPDRGSGPWPAVILYPDAPSVRPALFDMAQRIADGGYVVMAPDMFHRLGHYEHVKVPELLANMPRLYEMMGSTDPEKSMSDTGAFLDWLSMEPDVKGEKVGTTGYCMGGAIALRAAATFPDRVVAAASFHGGGLVTDTPDSPHLLAPKIKAKVLVAGAEKDDFYTAEQNIQLARAFADAGVEGKVGIWPGMLHGWVPSDMPVYDAEGSARHDRELLAFFDSALR